MHNIDNPNIVEGSRVKAFDYRLYKNDIETPLSVTLKEGTIICRYGVFSDSIAKNCGYEAGKYPDLVDIVFDHEPNKISHGHFTCGIKEI